MDNKEPPKSPKRITIKDIAEYTGFSANTVSHALHGKSDISQETQNLIKSKAQEIGYIRNNQASALRSGKSKLIAIIIPDISNQYFSIMVKIIENYLRKYGYSILVMPTEEQAEREEKAVYSALQLFVDGVILCPTQINNSAIELMIKNDVPFVLLGRWFEQYNYASVSVDDMQCGYLAARHLLSLGHRHILFLNSMEYISSSRERFEGYRKAFNEFNVPLEMELIKTIPPINDNANNDIKRDLQSLWGKYTAIFTFSDLIALQAAYILKSSGYSIPDSISLVSIDNIQSHIAIPFYLTTVDSPKEEIAKYAVQTILALIRKENLASVHKTFTPELIIRNSTKQLET